MEDWNVGVEGNGFTQNRQKPVRFRRFMVKIFDAMEELFSILIYKYLVFRIFI